MGASPGFLIARYSSKTTANDVRFMVCFVQRIVPTCLAASATTLAASATRLLVGHVTSGSLDATAPCLAIDDFAYEMLLRAQNGSMELFVRNLTRLIVQCQRSGCIAQEFHFVAHVHALSRSRIATDMGHVARDGERVDPSRFEPLLQLGVGKTAWEGFVQHKIGREIR